MQVIQNGEIYNYRELRERLERRSPLPDRQRHRGAGAPVRGARARLRRAACAACSRSPCGTGSSAGWCWRGTGSASSRCSTGSRAGRFVRLRAEGAAAPAGLLARGGHGRARGLPRVQLDSGAADDLHRGAQAARPATCWSCERGDVAIRRYSRPRPAPPERRARRERGGAGGRAARAPARLRARPPRRRRAGRRDAVGRHRLRRRSPRWPPTRAASASAPSRSGSRSAPSTSSTARAWWRSGSAPTITS